MYVHFNHIAFNIDDVEKCLHKHFPELTFYHNVQTIHTLSKETGKMIKIQRTILHVIEAPLIGAKLIIDKNTVSVKGASPHMNFTRLFKLIFGAGNKQRRELMIKICKCLASEFNGTPKDMHGRVLN